MITGIILASGFSERMKEDKLLMEIDGVPMIERVIMSCKLSYLDDLILIYRKEEVKRIGEKYGVKIYYNSNAHLGQSEALKLGVKKAENADAYMFLVGDQPFITSKLIDRLIDEYNKSKATIVVPYYNGENGTPTIFSSIYRDELLGIKGDKGGRDIMRKNIHLVKKVYIEDKKAGVDIDTTGEMYKIKYDLNMAVIRGGGDLATGIAYKLYKEGYRVVILEIDKPLTVRRAVAFSEAVYEGQTDVEGVKAILAKDKDHIYRILEEGNIPVYIDEKGSIIKGLKPLVLVDAIIAKKNLGTTKDMAPITIAIGPGFEAGIDVDLVVESNRGPNLGKIIYEGKAQENTGIPGEIMGYAEERILRAPCDGIVKSLYKIGDIVNKGDIVCQVGDEKVVAKFSGILRGMIKDGLYITKGLKLGDIDPRGIREYAFTISDKARIIGDSVLEAIQYLRTERNI